MACIIYRLFVFFLIGLCKERFFYHSEDREFLNLDIHPCLFKLAILIGPVAISLHSLRPSSLGRDFPNARSGNCFLKIPSRDDYQPTSSIINAFHPCPFGKWRVYAVLRKPK